MKVSKSMMVELRKLARDYCGGFKHVLEVQTWNRGNGPEIDIADFSEDDCDKSDVSHIELTPDVEIPDNAGQVDVAVFGTEYRGDDFDEQGTKLGYFYIELRDGKITESWQ